MRDRIARGATSAKKSRSTSYPDVEVLYSRYFLPLARRACWRYHVSPEDAFDLVQEAFALALVKMSDATNPRAWLTSVVDNLAVNHRRKSARRKELARLWLGPDRQEEPTLPGPFNEEADE
jgi:DNA-directed RNA polymerase specialized sigma24 family protein